MKQRFDLAEYIIHLARNLTVIHGIYPLKPKSNDVEEKDGGKVKELGKGNEREAQERQGEEDRNRGRDRDQYRDRNRGDEDGDDRRRDRHRGRSIEMMMEEVIGIWEETVEMMEEVICIGEITWCAG